MWPKRKLSQTKVPAKPSPEMIEEARRNPNGWVYVIDGTYGPNDAVSPECIVGAWKVDASGKLTDEYKPNPNYHPKAI